MNKIFYTVIAAACAISLFVTGCDGDSGPSEPEICTFDQYSPMRVGSYWIYEVRDLVTNEMFSDSLVVVDHFKLNGADSFHLMRYINGKAYSHTYAIVSPDSLYESIPTIIDDFRNDNSYCKCAGRTMMSIVKCNHPEVRRTMKRPGDTLPSLLPDGTVGYAFTEYDTYAQSSRRVSTLSSSPHPSFSNAPPLTAAAIATTILIRDSMKVYSLSNGIVRPGRFDSGRDYVASTLQLTRWYISGVGVSYELLDRRVYGYPDPSAYERSYYERRLVRYSL